MSERDLRQSKASLQTWLAVGMGLSGGLDSMMPKPHKTINVIKSNLDKPSLPKLKTKKHNKKKRGY